MFKHSLSCWVRKKKSRKMYQKGVFVACQIELQWNSLGRCISIASSGRRPSLGMDEVKELLPRLGVVAEDTQHGAGDGLAVDLLDSAHHHAHVPGTEIQRKLVNFAIFFSLFFLCFCIIYFVLFHNNMKLTTHEIHLKKKHKKKETLIIQLKTVIWTIRSYLINEPNFIVFLYYLFLIFK